MLYHTLLKVRLACIFYAFWANVFAIKCNTSVNYTTFYFIYNGIYVRATCFDLVGYPQALQENRSKSCLVYPHFGIPDAHTFQLQKQKYISLYKLNLLCDCFDFKLQTYPIW